MQKKSSKHFHCVHSRKFLPNDDLELETRKGTVEAPALHKSRDVRGLALFSFERFSKPILCHFSNTIFAEIRNLGGQIPPIPPWRRHWKGESSKGPSQGKSPEGLRILLINYH